MQSLSESRVTFTNSIWSTVAKLERDCLSKGVGHVQQLSSDITRNDPKLDSMMFLRHNLPNWQEPPDLGFEPSPVWHDDATMIVDDAAKVYLRNILGKSKAQRNELKRDVDRKRRDVDKARQVQRDVRAGRDPGRDEVETVRSVFALQESLHESERAWISAEVETATVVAAVGDISVGAQNHDFKAQTFKIPTNCDLCGERIWGLSAKGFDCRGCGYTCHSKCELKVPADCPGEQSKDERKRLKVERQAAAGAALAPAAAAAAAANGSAHPLPEGVAELAGLDRSNTMGSLSSGYAASAKRSVSASSARTPGSDAHPDGGGAELAAPTKKPLIGSMRKNRVVAPPPAAYVNEAPGDLPSSSSRANEPRGKMLYAYQAAGEGELTIDEGTEFTIIEADGASYPSCCKLSTGRRLTRCRRRWLDDRARRRQRGCRTRQLRRGTPRTLPLRSACERQPAGLKALRLVGNWNVSFRRGVHGRS